MAALPPSPFLAFSDLPSRSAETPVVASSPMPPPACDVATGTYSALASETMAEPAAAPGLTDPPVAAVGDIHEIFYHARRLLTEHHAKHHRFRLDEAAFAEAIEPPPLFLQRTA